MLENAGLVDIDMSVCGPMDDDEDQAEEVPPMDDEFSDDFNTLNYSFVYQTHHATFYHGISAGKPARKSFLSIMHPNFNYISCVWH